MKRKKKKNPAAVALAALRKTKSGGRNGGPPKSSDRCPCGKFTRTRAAQRRHVCDLASQPLPGLKPATGDGGTQ